MLKFKAFCLDYWQFLCLQPLHGAYKRYEAWEPTPGDTGSEGATTPLSLRMEGPQFSTWGPYRCWGRTVTFSAGHSETLCDL